MPFPNPATQLRGGERKGKPRPLIGKRRASKIKAVLAMAEVLRDGEPPLTGDALALLQLIYRNPKALTAARAACANAAAKLARRPPKVERPTVTSVTIASPATAPIPAPGGEWWKRRHRDEGQNVARTRWNDTC